MGGIFGESAFEVAGEDPHLVARAFHSDSSGMWAACVGEVGPCERWLRVVEKRAGHFVNRGLGTLQPFDADFSWVLLAEDGGEVRVLQGGPGWTTIVGAERLVRLSEGTDLEISSRGDDAIIDVHEDDVIASVVSPATRWQGYARPRAPIPILRELAYGRDAADAARALKVATGEHVEGRPYAVSVVTFQGA